MKTTIENLLCDSLLFFIGGIIWILVAVYYAFAGLMMEGTRVWASGAAIFLLLFLVVWYAERRGRANSTDTKGNTSEKPHGRSMEAGTDSL